MGYTFGLQVKENIFNPLVARYAMENNWSDEGGLYNGTPSGTPSFSLDAPVGTYSGSFDGSDSYVSIGNSTDLISSNLSFTGWVKINPASSGERAILARWDTAGGVNQRCFILAVDSSSKLFFKISSNGGDSGVNNVYLSSSAIAVDTWVFFSVTWDGSEIRGYINALLDGAPVSQSGIWSSTSVSTIGAIAGRGIGSGDSVLSDFNGLIDDIQIYRVVLSPAQIADIYGLLPQYTVNYNAGVNGSIVGTTPQAVYEGLDSSEVTATPDVGYFFNQWDDGVLTAARTDTITANLTVEASFVDTTTLDYATGANGSLTGNTSQTVGYGDNGTEVIAVPDSGYEFFGWSDGVLTAARTDLNITGSIDVTAYYRYPTPATGYWVQVCDGFYGQEHIQSTTIFNGRLYGSTRKGLLFRLNTSENGWELIADEYLGSWDVRDIKVWNNRLYGCCGAGTRALLRLNLAGNAWEKICDGYSTDASNRLLVSGNRLYGSTSGGRLIRLNLAGNAWESIAGPGNEVIPLIEFNGRIYGGAQPDLLRLNLAGNAWESLTSPLGGLFYIRGLTAYDGQIYASTYPGLFLKWNGTDAWEIIDTPSPNFGINDIIEFNGDLYGGQDTYGYLWRLKGPYFTTCERVCEKLNDQSTIKPLILYNNKLYAGTAGGARLFRLSYGLDSYTATYNAGANGSITGTAVQSIVEGQDTVEVTATPNVGYFFSQWDDGVLTAARTDTIINNLTVQAQFSSSTSLDYVAGVNGSLTGNTSQTVSYGGNGTEVIAVPDGGATFVQWSDGILTAARTDLSVTASIDVEAQFTSPYLTMGFYATPLEGLPSFYSYFTDLSTSNDIITYRKWTYGDGQSYESPYPNSVNIAVRRHTYSTSGVFTVTEEVQKGGYWINRGFPNYREFRRNIYANNLFVAVCRDFNNYWIYTSPDGVEWTERLNVSSADSSNFGLAYGHGKFIVTSSYNGEICESVDGINWTVLTGAGYYGMTSLAFGNNTFVGSHGWGTSQLVISTDGVNWSLIPFPTTRPHEVYFANGLFFVTEYDTDGCYYSSNLSSWTFIDLSALGISVGTEIAYGAGKYVFSYAGNGGIRFAYTTDLSTWNLAPPIVGQDRPWRALIYGNGEFIAGQGYNLERAPIARSVDGINWTSVLGPTNGVSALAISDRALVSSGEDTASITVVESDSTSRTNYVTSLPAPVTDFSGAPLTGDPPLDVQFTNLSVVPTSDVITASRTWNFGDSTSSTDLNPSHIYTDKNSYSVSLNNSVSSKYAYLDGVVDIKISGNYAYLASAYVDRLQILDISDPTNMSVLGNAYAWNLDPRGIDLSGNYAFVTSYSQDALYVYDVSDKDNPTSVTYIRRYDAGSPALDGAWGIEISGNYAYVTGYLSSGLEIVDITDPTAPVHAGKLLNGEGGALLYQPTSITLSGNYAFIASYGSSALEIVDISNPAAPVHAASLSNGEGGASIDRPVSVALSGNYAYVANQSSSPYYRGSLEVVNISNPLSPTHVGNISYSDPNAVLIKASSVSVSGNYAYVSLEGNSYGDRGGLEVIDISNPAAPVHETILYGDGSGVEITRRNLSGTIDGNIIYVGISSFYALLSVDITDPTNPVSIGNVYTNLGSTLSDIELKTDYVTTLSVFEVTSVEPDFGSVEGGTRITLGGSGFGSVQGDGYVKVGGKRITIISWSDTEIVGLTQAED